MSPGQARFEAGTGNIADAIALGAALDYVTEIGLPAICAYEHQLLDYGMRQIAAVPGLRLIGTAPQKASVLTFDCSAGTTRPRSALRSTARESRSRPGIITPGRFGRSAWRARSGRRWRCTTPTPRSICSSKR